MPKCLSNLSSRAFQICLPVAKAIARTLSLQRVSFFFISTSPLHTFSAAMKTENPAITAAQRATLLPTTKITSTQAPLIGHDLSANKLTFKNHHHHDVLLAHHHHHHIRLINHHLHRDFFQPPPLASLKRDPSAASYDNESRPCKLPKLYHTKRGFQDSRSTESLARIYFPL